MKIILNTLKFGAVLSFSFMNADFNSKISDNTKTSDKFSDYSYDEERVVRKLEYNAQAKIHKNGKQKYATNAMKNARKKYKNKSI